MAIKRLYRSCTDTVIGGVAGGLAEYLEIDVILVRLIFLVLLFSGGIGFLAYIVAWVIIPVDPKCNEEKTGAEEIKEKAEDIASEINKKFVKKGKENNNNNEASIWFGVILLFLGSMILIQNVTGVDVWRNFLPYLMIFIGIVILLKALKEKE
jgi:phage shock protein PspC (stress-responsive transcriptional regulator)